MLNALLVCAAAIRERDHYPSLPYKLDYKLAGGAPKRWLLDWPEPSVEEGAPAGYCCLSQRRRHTPSDHPCLISACLKEAYTTRRAWPRRHLAAEYVWPAVVARALCARS